MPWRPTVQHNADLDRIRDLPRRDWRNDKLGLLTQLLTQSLRQPGGDMSLFPVQAAALADLYDYGGLFAPIQVGGGKTLLSLLAPVVTGAQRPVILVPAALRDKTRREYQVLAQHWKLKPVSVQSYETLSRRNGDAWLEHKQPDLIVADEAHRLKNTRAAVTRKVSRYLRKGGCKFACMSGTMTSRSIREYWHLIHWALGSELAPVPKQWEDMIAWGLALDSKVDSAARMSPGPLITLGPCDRHDPEIKQGRDAFADRLYHTPGVVVVRDARPPNGLEVRTTIVDLPNSLSDHFAKLRGEWETPDGHPFESAMDLWRHARELACGFYYRWDPRPPRDWMDARRAWSKFVRETLNGSRTLDSPMQVVVTIDRGQLEDYGLLAHWREVKPTFTPNSVPVWVCDSALQVAADWLAREGGLCWVEHRAFGQRLSQETGVPYFAQQGLDLTGKRIDQHTGPAIASSASCSTGFNLQRLHHKNLIVSCEPTGKLFEQLLGRTHRHGQEADTVTADVYVACQEQAAGLYQAIADAEYAQPKIGPQKLCYATLDIPTPDDLASRPGPAWGQ